MSSRKDSMIKNPTNVKAHKAKETDRDSIEIEDLRLGMERRKFSYTIHIPERKLDQNHCKSVKSIKSPETDMN